MSAMVFVAAGVFLLVAGVSGKSLLDTGIGAFLLLVGVGAGIDCLVHSEKRKMEQSRYATTVIRTSAR